MAAPKVSKGRSESPLVASAEAKSPACRKDLLCLKDQLRGRAHLARQYASGRMCSLGARLRTRKITGRDASLPAPLLETFAYWSPAERLGRCPKPLKGAPPLDPARGNFPLDPSARLSWSLLLTSSACCSFGASPKTLFRPTIIKSYLRQPSVETKTIWKGKERSD